MTGKNRPTIEPDTSRSRSGHSTYCDTEAGSQFSEYILYVHVHNIFNPFTAQCALALQNCQQDAWLNLSHVMRKPDFCICENKDADQLRGYREADQRLCFRYIDSTIPLVPKYEILSL